MKIVILFIGLGSRLAEETSGIKNLEGYYKRK